MNQLTTFQFHTTPVRVIPKDDGLSFWVIGKDVADALGYAEAKDALRQVPDHHKGRHRMPTLKGEQELLCIDEAGLYRLVLRSNKPEAEPFMEWVTAEVLPAIRRTGAYVHPQIDADQLARIAAVLGQELLRADPRRRALIRYRRLGLTLPEIRRLTGRGHEGLGREYRLLEACGLIPVTPRRAAARAVAIANLRLARRGQQLLAEAAQ